MTDAHARRRFGFMDWRSALAEVVLIVVGILIAMAASDWHDRRVARRTELSILRELRTSLTADLETLENTLERHRSVEAKVASLLDHLRAGRPSTDSLDALFGAEYSFRTVELNPASYESLKSRGLDLISEDALRAHITDTYERVYPSALASAQLEQEVVLDLLRPYFLAHFKDLRIGSTATPLDYESVSTDVLFLNITEYRLQVFRQNHVPRTERAMGEIQSLLEGIQAELGPAPAS